MASRLALCCLILLTAGTAADPARLAPPPNVTNQIERFIVNLDLPPRERFVSLVQAKKEPIMLLLDTLEIAFAGSAPAVSKDLVAAVNGTISTEFREEMEGIGDALGVSYEYVLMANLFYEITGVADTPLDLSRSCTSIAAQHANGTVFLARNQDYPPPFVLVMTHFVFQRGGATVYEGTSYAGTIGLSTGMSARGGFAVSINARSNPAKGTAAGTTAALAAASRGASIFPIFIRQALEAAGADFVTGLAFMKEHELIMPGYVIVAGSRPGQGGIVTRDPTGFDFFELFDKRGTDAAGGDWFTVQTNTDHGDEAPNYPLYNVSRRAQAVKVLGSVGKSGVDFTSLWQVLSTHPVLNPTTIHTDLTLPAAGFYQTYQRSGPI